MHASKNNPIWQPGASFESLAFRARTIQRIRQFFADRQVLEVETPLLCHTSVTDPYIQSISAVVPIHAGTQEKRYYLQTSPEYAMKRLLAAGSGCIYQICKAFRQDEAGRFHNPEFTMLEWYRLNFTHHDLMDEMDELLQYTLQIPAAERVSYTALFQQYLNVTPHEASLADLAALAKDAGIALASEIDDRDTWLNLLMSHCIEPNLGKDKPCFIYDFPASQAALARLIPGNPPVAARFEVYFKGLELANGFYELQDAGEQRRRFEDNLKIRESLGLPTLPIDERFLSALTQGLPDCSGVALGVDRLIMLAAGQEKISEVLSFDFDRV